LSLEAIPELGTAGADGSIGVVKLNGTVLPVYNFDEHLQLHGGVQDNRPCVCLGAGRTAFALLCDKVETVEGAALQIVKLPACLRSAHTPVQSLVLQGARILCVSSVERFSGLINVSRKDEVKP
jgi:chemotaxis signal transduction protein